MSARAAAEDAIAEVRLSEATIRKTLTQREQAEEALREGEERYRELVENANDIVYLEFDGRISSINRAAQQITEYSQDELLMMKLQDILAPESRAVGEEMLNASVNAPEKTSYEIQIISKTGQTVTLEMNARTVFRKGKPVGIQGIARDISTRKRAPRKPCAKRIDELSPRMNGFRTNLRSGTSTRDSAGTRGDI